MHDRRARVGGVNIVDQPPCSMHLCRQDKRGRPVYRIRSINRTDAQRICPILGNNGKSRLSSPLLMVLCSKTIVCNQCRCMVMGPGRECDNPDPSCSRVTGTGHGVSWPLAALQHNTLHADMTISIICILS